MEYNTEIHDWWLILINYFTLFQSGVTDNKRQLALLQFAYKLANPASNGKKDNMIKEI